MAEFRVENLSCASCAQSVEQRLTAEPGIQQAVLNFATGRLRVEGASLEQVQKIARQVEPDLKLVAIDQPGNAHSQNTPTGRALHPLLPWAAALLLFGAGLFARQFPAWGKGWGEALLFGAAYLISGGAVLRRAFRQIRRGAFFDENFLMAVATLGAIAIREWPEAVGVMLFYQLGEYFQNLAVHRARGSIRGLLAHQPETANLCVEDGLAAVPPQQVEVGQEILVRPGERVPLDGEVVSGQSMLDTSALTGESMPRSVEPGAPVLAGMLNQSGALRVRVSRLARQSTLSQMLDLIEHAAERKAVTEKFITRFARWYSPAMLFAALGVAILPPLLLGAPWTVWIRRALVLLVISCPCALVISIPLGYFGGIGSASRHGVLVKGAHFLDVLADVRAVVFDKTGTLTQGDFRVTEIRPQKDWTSEQLMQASAQAESYSRHPIAQSIRAAAGVSHLPERDADVQEIPGQGVVLREREQTLLAGSDALLHREQIPHEVCLTDGTAVHVAVNGRYAGHLRVADQVRAESGQAVARLRALGVEQIWMLTGDNTGTARRVADQLQLDAFQAELLPPDKVAHLEDLIAGRKGSGKVAFVGDGFNDAPVLARADVGIAMGGLGSPAAIQAADVVLMTDQPTKVAEAIRIGRFTRRIVWQNIGLALGVKALFIVLGVAGMVSMWAAVFADVGVALLAVLNATRVLRA